MLPSTFYGLFARTLSNLPEESTACIHYCENLVCTKLTWMEMNLKVKEVITFV